MPKRSGIGPTVNQDVLAGKVAGVHAALPGAEPSELRRIAEPSGRDGGGTFGFQFRNAAAFGPPLPRTTCATGRWRTRPAECCCSSRCDARSGASPATNPSDPSVPIGTFAALDVMITMRPNHPAIVPSTVALMSSIGVSLYDGVPDTAIPNQTAMAYADISRPRSA
jgi:hypothetical protein